VEQRQVGRSGLQVSRLGLGTSTWGRDTDELEAADLLHAFLDAGGDLVETGPAYADGAAEHVLGAVLAGRVARRDLVVVARAGSPRVGTVDRSRRGLLRSLDETLTRIGCDDLDLLLIDGWNDAVPFEEALSAVDAAVATGRAAYAGVSAPAGWHVARMAAWQEGARRTPLVAAAAEWSLVARHAEREIVPAARASGMGVIAGAGLGRGVLTAKYRHGIPSDSRAASTSDAATVEPLLAGRARSVVDAVVTAADGLGVPPLSVALAWLLDRPGLTAALVGPRTLAQLRGVLAAEQAARVPDAILAALDDVSR
jgi:aryl-alcohol dehydrogenase-like predicted oxidoreductase